MSTEGWKDANLRAERERPSLGILSGRRPEPTLDEAREELATALSRMINSLFKDRYGTLVGALSQPTLVEILKSFEGNLLSAKGDVTLVAQELLDRVIPPRSKFRR
jgi:hypothetical protein